jgi:hypothetical protein
MCDHNTGKQAMVREKIKIKSFESFTLNTLHNEFGLQRVSNHAVLQEWMQERTTFKDDERSMLEQLQAKLLRRVDHWNEMELQFNFIGPFMIHADFNQDQYQSFAQRNMQATILDTPIGGRVDFLVATGIDAPLKPFFFLHEYKRKRGGENDPLAQLLAEMLVAQKLNDSDGIMYGCYVIGQLWHFVVLDGRTYDVAPAFDTASDDIFLVVAILRKVKDYIEEILATYPNVLPRFAP